MHLVAMIAPMDSVARIVEMSVNLQGGIGSERRSHPRSGKRHHVSATQMLSSWWGTAGTKKKSTNTKRVRAPGRRSGSNGRPLRCLHHSPSRTPTKAESRIINVRLTCRRGTTTHRLPSTSALQCRRRGPTRLQGAPVAAPGSGHRPGGTVGRHLAATNTTRWAI